jgi:cell division protein FtsZ
MNTSSSSLLLLGIGGTGSATVRGVRRAYGAPLRALAVDTDASSGNSPDIPFLLIGGDRLAGRGAGGLPAEARAAFLDKPDVLDGHLDGVRTAIIATALGGGTGSGATGEIVKHLSERGITSIVFATQPFLFEGEERISTATTAFGLIEHTADVTVPLPLDALVADAPSDNMKDALQIATDTLSTALTLFWRMLEKPGYIALDAERLHNAAAGSGRARFATAAAFGPNRAEDVLRDLSSSRLLADGNAHAPVKSIFIGILAGDDLRLSEVSRVADGFRAAFGRNASFQLGTVNDEATFSGRLSVAVLVFEESAIAKNSKKSRKAVRNSAKNRRNAESALAAASRFMDCEKTIWHDEDLDIPTYLRRNLTLDR